MAMVNYEGELGKFVYDDSEYSIRHDDFGEYIHYDGKETDGKKIKIPEGITNLRAAFEWTHIKSMPDIPDGVTNLDYAFQACDELVTTGSEKIPDSVTSMNAAFSYCMKIQTVPDMPDSVESACYMLDGSKNVIKLGHISENLRFADFMCHDCSKFEGSLDMLPEAARNDTVFENTKGNDESLGDREAVEKSIADRDAAYGITDEPDVSDDAEELFEQSVSEKPEPVVDRNTMPFEFNESEDQVCDSLESTL